MSIGNSFLNKLKESERERPYRHQISSSEEITGHASEQTTGDALRRRVGGIKRWLDRLGHGSVYLIPSDSTQQEYLGQVVGGAFQLQ